MHPNLVIERSMKLKKFTEKILSCSLVNHVLISDVKICSKDYYLW